VPGHYKWVSEGDSEAWCVAAGHQMPERRNLVEPGRGFAYECKKGLDEIFLVPRGRYAMMIYGKFHGPNGFIEAPCVLYAKTRDAEIEMIGEAFAIVMWRTP
jgi:hypothetical protein